MNTHSLTHFAWLSILAAVLTIGLKGGAYLLTGSVGLLSDALESLVNLVAAFAALWALTVASRPADAEHAYGHSKVEYFSSGLEGALILVAAASIAYTAGGCSTRSRSRTSAGVSRSRRSTRCSIWASPVSCCVRAARTTRSRSKPTRST